MSPFLPIQQAPREAAVRLFRLPSWLSTPDHQPCPACLSSAICRAWVSLLNHFCRSRFTEKDDFRGNDGFVRSRPKGYDGGKKSLVVSGICSWIRWGYAGHGGI